MIEELMRKSTFKQVSVMVTVAALWVSTSAWAVKYVEIIGINKRAKQVSFSMDGSMTWTAKDWLCAFYQKKAVLCGEVVDVSSEKINIRVREVRGKVSRGMIVQLSRVSRQTASHSTSESVSRPSGAPTWDVGAGVVSGLNYFFPIVHFQRVITNKIALGVMPLYVNYSGEDSSVKALGGFVTASYYLTQSPFKDFFVTAGAGMYSISATVGTDEESHSNPAVLLTGNWRGQPFSSIPIDVSAGVGFQYIVPAERTLTESFSSILPVFTLTLAYPF